MSTPVLTSGPEAAPSPDNLTNMRVLMQKLVDEVAEESRARTTRYQQRGAAGFHYNPVNATNHPEVRTMPKCAACGAELEPPVRTPHTVYVKTLYHIAGQDYCRHHIIRAAVAVGVVTEVKTGASLVVLTNRGAPSEKHFRPFQG